MCFKNKKKVEELSESVKEFEEARRKADEEHKREIKEEISVISARPGGTGSPR